MSSEFRIHSICSYKSTAYFAGRILYEQSKSEFRRGQSLVEMALTLPILIIMLLGVFEVGYYIYDFLVISNVSRETARFGARFIDNGQVPLNIRFDQIRDQGVNSGPGWFAEDFNGEAKMILTYMEALGGQVCEVDEDCDCEVSYTTPITPPVVLYPTPTNLVTYTVSYGLTTTTYTTRISTTIEAQDMANGHLLSNCLKRQRQFSANDTKRIFVEVFYNHRLIFGIPFLPDWKSGDVITIYDRVWFPVLVPARGSGQQ